MFLAHFFIGQANIYSFSFFLRCACYYVGKTLCILLHATPIATAAGETDEESNQTTQFTICRSDMVSKWNKLSSISRKSRALWLRLVKVNSFSGSFTSKLSVFTFRASICFQSCSTLSVSLFPTTMGFSIANGHGTCATIMYFTPFLPLNTFLHPRIIFGGMYLTVRRKRMYVLYVAFFDKKLWYEKKQCIHFLPNHVPFFCNKKLTSFYASSMDVCIVKRFEQKITALSLMVAMVMIKLMTNNNSEQKMSTILWYSHTTYRFMHSKYSWNENWDPISISMDAVVLKRCK